jgi:hypothetical protein
MPAVANDRLQKSSPLGLTRGCIFFEKERLGFGPPKGSRPQGDRAQR